MPTRRRAPPLDRSMLVGARDWRTGPRSSSPSGTRGRQPDLDGHREDLRCAVERVAAREHAREHALLVGLEHPKELLVMRPPPVELVVEVGEPGLGFASDVGEQAELLLALEQLVALLLELRERGLAH